MKLRSFAAFAAATLAWSSMVCAEVVSPDMSKRQIEGGKIYAPVPHGIPDMTRTKVEGRACQDVDLTGGMWKMIYSRETPAKQHARFNRKVKYQYLTFDAAHYHAKLRSSKSIDDPALARQMVKPDRRPVYEQKYIINHPEEKKTEVIFFQGKKPVYRHDCTIVVKPSGQYKPGDMILTGYTLNGKSLLYELYRRWF